MKSREAFDSFYNTELKQKIEQMEAQRVAITEKYSFKKYKRNLKWLVILLILAGVINALVPADVSWMGLIVAFLILYAIVGGIYIYFKRANSFKPIKVEYKQTIIPKIISFVDTNLTYQPNEGISRQEFDSGNLFGGHTSYKSEDLVQGKTVGMEIKMADIECTRTSSSRGKDSSSSTVTVFKGFYIISKVDTAIPSGVTIKSSFALSEAIKSVGKLLGGFIKMIDDRLNLSDVETGDPEFDKMYNVKSVSPEVAKALLTPKFIQLIMTFRKEINLPVSFSFFDNNVHIAFSGVNLFEADVNVSFIEKDISRQYFNYLNLAYGIVEAIKVAR